MLNRNHKIEARASKWITYNTMYKSINELFLGAQGEITSNFVFGSPNKDARHKEGH